MKYTSQVICFDIYDGGRRREADIEAYVWTITIKDTGHEPDGQHHHGRAPR